MDREHNDRGKVNPSSKVRALGAGGYDLGVPGITAKCVEDMYRSVGASPHFFDRLAIIALAVGILLGLYFGYEPGHYERGEMLYGPIGSAIGFVFGLAGGGAVGALIHWVLAWWFKPEEYALKMIRSGKLQSAVSAMNRTEKKIHLARKAGSLRFILEWLGLIRSDIPHDIHLANINGAKGIIAESAGDSQSALAFYLNALQNWSRHGFIIVSLLDLIIREEMTEFWEEAKEIAEKFVSQTRDTNMKRAVKEYLDTIDPGITSPSPTTDRGKIAESPSSYDKTIKADDIILCRLVENPGSQISNGMFIVQTFGTEKKIKLPPMPFQLLLTLGKALESSPSTDDEQRGWVSINELLQTLPWTTSSVTNSNVHKLVYKTRSLFAEHGIDRYILEENQNGCYRLNIPSEKLEIEMLESERHYGKYNRQYRK